MKKYLLLYYCLRIFTCVDTNQDDTSFELKVRSGNGRFIGGTLQSIVKTYHCIAENVGEQQVILYGSRAWTFPIQNVNLTLRYPSENSDGDQYIITGLLVVLYINGPESRGYITEGGIFMDSISMTFVSENISRLSYQFWLYGVSKSRANASEYIWQQNFC